MAASSTQTEIADLGRFAGKYNQSREKMEALFAQERRDRKAAWEQRRRDREAVLEALIILDSAPEDDPDRFTVKKVKLWRISRITDVVGEAINNHLHARTVVRELVALGYLSHQKKAHRYINGVLKQITVSNIDVTACLEDLADGVDVP